MDPPPAAASKPGGYEDVLRDIGVKATQVHAVLEKVSSAKQLVEDIIAVKEAHTDVQKWLELAGSAEQTACAVPDFLAECIEQPSSCKKGKEALEAFKSACAGERKALVPHLEKQYQQAYARKVRRLFGVGDAVTTVLTSLKLICEFMELSELCSRVSTTSATIRNLVKRLKTFHKRYIKPTVAFLESNPQDAQELTFALEDAQEDLANIRCDIEVAMGDVRNTGGRGLHMMLSSIVEAFGLLAGLWRGPREVLSNRERAFVMARAGAHAVVAAASGYVVVRSTLHARELKALVAECDKYLQKVEDVERELSRRSRAQ